MIESKRVFAWAMLVLLICGAGCSSNSTTTPSPPVVVNKTLWVANGTDVLEFLPSQLVAGATDPAPHLVDKSSVFGAPQGVTFDTAGDLWVVDGGTVSSGGAAKPALYEFTSAQLLALGTNPAPSPAVTVDSAEFTFPQQAVFDGSGNLWVSDNGSNKVFEFTAAQLAAGGANVTPNISLASSPAFNGPLGIAFDPGGDLFVANNGSTTIFKFNSVKLPTKPGSVTVTTSVVLSNSGNSIQAPWALAFDTSGDLWSSNANAPFTVVEFSAKQLDASGSPAPVITLSPGSDGGNATLAAPNGIAFDNIGGLSAVSSATPFGVAVFGAGQLKASGTVTPATLVVGPDTTLNAPAGDTFGPVVN